MPRHALIVGGTRGIGRAIAADLLDRGWRVSLASRTTRAPDLERQGATWHRADASVPAQARTLVETTAPLDALVLSAGPYHRARLLEERYEDWRRMFAHNVDSAFVLCQEALPHMIARGWGRILTFGVANVARVQANPELPAYYAAKVALLALTRAVAHEGAPHGVTANCISPGVIDTGSSPPGELERMGPRIPAGRVGDPRDVVGAARFLLSEEAAYVNGANLVISGGWGI
ncbi:MAG: SDR family oxidoreductase [Alphaproteobacteria bacterium]|nr:SDR family oxidoreductase [Alphaproteobacteria bacterium]